LADIFMCQDNDFYWSLRFPWYVKNTISQRLS
jgi:hypothetical protein